MPVTNNPFPASPADVNSQTGAITVPMLLAQPTRITRAVAELAMVNYWAYRVLPNAGGVSGGGVIFDIATPGDAFSGREPEPIAPGAEFPVVNSAEPIPGSAPVTKWGAKIEVTDEKRDRNDVRYTQRELVRATNSMIRRLHQNTITALETAITAYSRTDTWTTQFGNIVEIGATGDTAPLARPAADVQAAQAVADNGEYMVTYDTLLVNSLDYAELQAAYWRSNVNQGIFPEGNGTVIPSNLVTQGTSYLIASNEAGETRWEKPLGTETWREQKHEATYIQLSARAVHFVDNPYAVLKFTGA